MLFETFSKHPGLLEIDLVTSQLREIGLVTP